MTYSPLALSPVSSLSSDSESELAAEQTKTVQPASARGNVFARLQALFPSSPSTVTHGHEHVQAGSIAPTFLKIRVMSWNHHESLPKGDLVELLGEVTPVDPKCPEERPSLPSIPQFAPDGKHPYHLVVVAGQECPSLSGIPMGLGAGFKLKEKEKEKEAIQDAESVAPTNSYGWTAILEDWYSHAGSAHVIDKRRGFRNVPSIPSSPIPPSATIPDLKRRKSIKPPLERKGPYEMLIKERMMGLYLAIYIHRDIKHLVRGASKSAVTAGLIGGRVGNKGGVGISVNLDGSTLLFINAHLAAHEGRVMHRLNNMQKIKANLSVDDFLDKDDPRVMAEDVTDKYDYTFICGDLNFRLDISRLHADWLLSRKDYTQALAFDQLRNLMQNQQAFVGFQEAPINFPPTFKYDVLRTIKRGKSKRSAKYDGDHPLTLTEIEERERDAEDDEGEGEGGGEAGSMASSAYTSVHSKLTAERNVDDEDYFMRPRASRASTGNLVNKVWAATAAHKAKHKWMGILRPGTPTKSTAPSTLTPKQWSHKTRRSSLDGLTISSRPAPPSATEDSSVKSSGTPLRSDGDSNPVITLTEDEIDDQDRGVYDSSSKKRVPSWCDRIIYKSTVEPDPEEEEATEQSVTRSRTRVGNFFANAFRIRTRRSSHSSNASVSTESAHPPPPPPPPPPKEDNTGMPNVVNASMPFSRFPQAPAYPVLKRPNSIDDIPRSISKPVLSRSTTVGAETAKSRRRASTALPLPRSKITTVALETDSPATPSPPVNTISAEASPSLDTPPPVPPKEIRHIPSRWRFLPFFNWNSSQGTISHEHPSTEEDVTTPGAAPIPPRPRKGDIVCLSYDSLDDRAMRRLEGRSDHRPIIGSYAVYL